MDTGLEAMMLGKVGTRENCHPLQGNYPNLGSLGCLQARLFQFQQNEETLLFPARETQGATEVWGYLGHLNLQCL